MKRSLVLVAADLYGYSADRTLELAQSLYDTHKALTYPRTSSRYMTENDVSFFEACLSFAAPEVKVNPSDKRIFDGSKVEDHHALLVCDRPTEAFSPEERNIYNIVAASMRQATGQPALIELRRKQRSGVGRSLQVNNTRTLVQNRIKDLETLLKIRQKNKTLIGYRMKFLFWLMNFKILSGEINETNFYETAEKIARQIDPSWKWRKQELGALRYSRIRTSGNSVSKNSLNKNFNRIYIFGSKINILFQASRNSSLKISVPEFPDTLHRPV